MTARLDWYILYPLGLKIAAAIVLSRTRSGCRSWVTQLDMMHSCSLLLLLKGTQFITFVSQGSGQGLTVYDPRPNLINDPNTLTHTAHYHEMEDDPSLFLVDQLIN